MSRGTGAEDDFRGTNLAWQAHSEEHPTHHPLDPNSVCW
jgi:hypothetical protein